MRLGNHQPLVFGPSRTCAADSVRRTLDLGSERGARSEARRISSRSALAAGGCDVALVRGQHCVERIGGREHDFRDLPRVLLGDLRREHVFQFVREFAELRDSRRPRNRPSACAPPGGRGELVRRPPGRSSSRGQRRSCPAEFPAALSKKSSRSSAAAFVGEKVHGFPSIRWYAVPLFSWIMRNFCVRPNRLSAWPTKR